MGLQMQSFPMEANIETEVQPSKGQFSAFSKCKIANTRLCLHMAQQGYDMHFDWYRFCVSAAIERPCTIRLRLHDIRTGSVVEPSQRLSSMYAKVFTQCDVHDARLGIVTSPPIAESGSSFADSEAEAAYGLGSVMSARCFRLRLWE